MKKTLKVSTRKPIWRISIILLATYIGLFAMLYAGITPEQYDINVGEPAPIQILATKEVLDSVTTEQLREAAANSVEPSYKSVDNTIITSVMSDLTSELDALKKLRSEMTAEEARALTSSEVTQINEERGTSITSEYLATLIETNDETVDAAFTLVSEEVREILKATLLEGQEYAALMSIRSELNKSYSSSLTGLLLETVRDVLRPNMLIDEEITEANRQKARDAVEPKMCVKGEVIVREGDIVTLAQYTMIASLGITSENSFDVQLLIGIALLVLLIMGSLYFYLHHYYRNILESPKMLLLLCLIMVLVIGISLLMSMVHNYMLPVSLGLLLVALLIDTHLAVFINVLLALLASMLITTGNGMYSVALMTILCGPVIATLFSHRTLRSTTLLAGVIIGAVNFLITLAFGLFSSAEMHTVIMNALWAASGGAVSAILCIALQPLFESMFNLATNSKLIELSNPNHPLLRRLLLEASGTYHHSIIVANLAEAGCTAIGANGLLARVGSYYHDIGKLKRPMYFKENQMGDNPHDRTDPRVSTAILTAHTRDGAQMAQKARIPEAVINIIRQHHGDTPVMYFFDKAQKLYGDQVDIANFRYEGPRPQSREAAVVMLADTLEAATRALPNPDPEKIDALIHKLVRAKLNDGQLDNCDLTFSDLDKICAAFSTVLTGVFHERIEYPDVTIPPRLEKPEAAQPTSVQDVQPAAQKPSAAAPEANDADVQSAAAKQNVPLSSPESKETPRSPFIGQPTPPVPPAADMPEPTETTKEVAENVKH